MPEDSAPARLSARLAGRWPIALVLVGSFVLYVWNLAINQWANSFYTAAIWSGSRNLEAAFYGSLDPSNAISIDKPPAAFWLPEILVRIFGLHSWTVILPNALLGVATVAMVYLIVRRVAGENAAVLGAAITALTPVAALMFRYDNPDALLVFLLLTAGYATIRAVEEGGRRWLVAAGLLVGFAILTKMLQAGLVVPVFALVYFLAAPGAIVRRLVDLLWAAGAILVGCGWWFAIVALTPAADRPFIDGTTNNSIFDLVFGYNGFGRLTGGDGNEATSGGGVMRLLHGDAAPMVSWLLPTAAFLAAVALVRVWRRSRADAQRVTLLIGAGSLVISALFFSFMGGIYHDYYALALVPWIGVTIAVAAAIVGRRTLAVAVVVTGLWAWHVLHLSPVASYRTLGWLVLVAGVAAAGALVLVRGRLAATVLAVAAVVSLIGPGAYALRVPAHAYLGAKPVVTSAVSMNLSAVSGSPLMTTHCPKLFGGASLPVPGYGQAPSIPEPVAQVLRTDTGTRPWVAATIGSERAGAYELASGQSVMAIGGYKIRTPGISLTTFKELVKVGAVRFFLPVCVWPIDETSYLISAWVWQHYEPTIVGGLPVIDFEKPRPTVS